MGMAASMLVPTFGVIALLWSGLIDDVGTLHVIEHVVMLPSMFVAMLLRLDEYTRQHGHAHQAVADGPVSADTTALRRSGWPRPRGRYSSFALAVHVVGCDDDLDAAERRVCEVYVDVRVGELAGELTERAGPVLDVDHEDLTLVGYAHGGVPERLACPCHVFVVDQDVDDAAPLAGECRKTPNVHAAATERFAEPRELARAVIQNHGEISRHRSALSNQLRPVAQPREEG